MDAPSSMKQGVALLFTLILCAGLSGCFGGGGSSKADSGSGDRSTDTAGNDESSLQRTDAFSVEAGEKYLHTDPMGVINLVGTINHPDTVTIAESYWRTFSVKNGFQRITSTVSASDADNEYVYTAGRYLNETVHLYQFVAIDTLGRAAVDDVYIRINAYDLSLDAEMVATTVSEGDSFALTVVLDAALAEDLTLNFGLQSGSAVVGEDVADCSPCSLVIPAGDTDGVLTLETLTDDVEEGQESFRLSLLNHTDALGGDLDLELLINDAGDTGLEIVNFARESVTATEKDGRVIIPVTLDYPYDEPELPVARAVFAAKPYVAASYGGSATSGVDYSASGAHAVYYDDNGNPYLVVDIIDDTESEDIETLVITISSNEFYDVGEGDTVTVTIQSDDVRLMASATDSYCTVDDHVSIRCWGDFRDRKTATPPLGTIKKLVGASDYFCAIHEDDGNNRLNCWGNVPGGAVDVTAPDDVIALDDFWCELRGTTANCFGNDSGAVEGVAGIVGGHRGLCFLGDGPSCNPRELPPEVRALLTPGAQFFYDQAYLGNSSNYSVACARAFDKAAGVYTAACDSVPLPENLSNPIALAAVNLDYQLFVCVIDETDSGNELVCVNRNGDPVSPFAGRNIEEPMMLSSDFDTHLCVSHLNGVDCLEWQGVPEQVPLINLQNRQFSDISGGFSLGSRQSTAGLCGIGGGDMYCVQPGFYVIRQPESLGDDAMARLDFETNMPAVVSARGELSVYMDFGQGVFRQPIELAEPLTENAPFAKGDGFVCYESAGNVNCFNYSESGVNAEPGSVVAGATQLAAGDSEACALVNSRVLCWGTGSPIEPLALAQVEDDFVAMDFAGQSGCAATAANSLHCWGTVAQFIGSTGLGFSVGNVQAVATANTRACVLGDQGIRCWTARSATGVEINANDVSDITVTNDFACVLDDKRVRCWGDYQNQPQLDIAE